VTDPLPSPNEPPIIAPMPGGAPVIAPPILAPPPRRLTAGWAAIILLIYLGAQFGASVVVGGVVGFYFGVMHAVHRAHGPLAQDIARAAPKMLLWGVVFAMLGGGLTMVAAARAMLREPLKDRSAVGAAWVGGSPRDCAEGLAVGILAGLGAVAVILVCNALGIHGEPGLFSKLLGQGGLRLASLLATLVIVAPVFEELLFRGVLYAGLRASSGALRAGALTTGIFVLLHFSELINFPPAMLCLGGLGALTLWIRLRRAAIGPAIGVHMGYNLVVVGAALTAGIQ